MPKKDPRLSTKWWKSNRDDARQIAARFHLGEPQFDHKVEVIYGAIAGRPKAEILGMVRWLLERELEYEIAARDDETLEPFDAATWLKNWRISKEEEAEYQHAKKVLSEQ